VKITTVYGNMTHYDNGLSLLVKRVDSVFAELGVETETIDLGALHPPYFDGETTTGIDNVVQGLKNSQGIVFACTAQLFAPTALMSSFLEYFSHPQYNQVLKGKHCFLIMLSNSGGEKSALEHLTRVVQSFGGYVVTQVGLQLFHMEGLSEEANEVGEFVDKSAEDFYRAVNQGRKYVIPSDAGAFVEALGTASGVSAVSTPGAGMSATEVTTQSNVPGGLFSTDPLLNSVHMHSRPVYFTDQQEKEVDELSQLFSEKYSNGDYPKPGTDDDADALLSFGRELLRDKPPPVQAPFANPHLPPLTAEPQMLPPVMGAPPVAPPAPYRAKTTFQITQNLPRYFQPQLSAGLQCVIQLNITGEEKFEGFLYIHSTECSFTEGTAPAPDVIIMADSVVWLDILKGKSTAQKAFMIGGLKVRGDFVLLTKFDALFKLENV